MSNTSQNRFNLRNNIKPVHERNATLMTIKHYIQKRNIIDFINLNFMPKNMDYHHI